jgi:hypothetical protein
LHRTLQRRFACARGVVRLTLSGAHPLF